MTEKASDAATADPTVWLDVGVALAGQGGLIAASLVVLLALWWFRKPFEEQLLPKMTGVKAGGIEVTFAEKAMAEAAVEAKAHNVVVEATVEKKVDITERDKERALRRAERCREILAGKRILWVDDAVTNNRRERDMLEAFGLKIEQAATNAEAMAALQGDRHGGYDLVVSDMARPDDSRAGLALLDWLRQRQVRQPLIFYVTNLDRDRPLPLGAFGITNRPDTLLHLVIDALERWA